MNLKPDKTFAEMGLVVPPQPHILVAIEELMRKQNINLRAIAQLVSQDSILAGIFLRTINSSYYGLDHKIESAEESISMIGLQQTLNIIRAEALKRATVRGAHTRANRRLHERAQQIAQFLSIIASSYLPEYLSPEIAYLIGQFHDCGIPVIMQRYPDYCASLNSPNPKLPDLFKEDRSIGINHCEVGYHLAENWKLPPEVCSAIRCHHDISQADEYSKGYVAALQMAMHLYNRMHLNDDSEWEINRNAVLQELEIAAEDLDEFELSVQETFREQMKKD
jgi:HD-like signal output (HDOD) protein